MSSFSAKAELAPQSKLLTKAALIYAYTHASASSLLEAFDAAKSKRGNPRGILTDSEQDILRAALVMSCAGVDAALKQTIRDCLEHLLGSKGQVRDGFEKFIKKRIAGDTEASEGIGGAKFLASVLAEKEPRKRLIEEYVKELTGESLQSSEEIMRTVSALGLEPKILQLDIPALREVFLTRNKIIHELDIDLGARPRKRIVRGQQDLIGYCEIILSTIIVIVETIDNSIMQPQKA